MRWQLIRNEITEQKETRLTLEGEAWELLDELKTISQEDLYNDFRKELYRDSDGDVYYIRPGIGVIFRIDGSSYDTRKFRETVKEKVRNVPNEALEKLIIVADAK